MAKKTGTKVKKTASSSDVRTLAGIKACELAGRRLKSRLEDKKARLDPDSYAVNVTLKIGGDVVVEKNQTVAEKSACRFTDSDLLIGIMVGLTTEEVAELIGRAIAANKDAEKTGAAGARFDRAKSLLNTVTESEAKKRGVWKTTAKSEKAGKTTGAPSVRISGTVNAQPVDIDIEAGGGGGDDDD